jgi:PAS domain S-box-containing protein
MTIKRKLILGLTLATLGASFAAVSGILPLHKASEIMRGSRDPELRVAAEAIDDSMKPALIAAGLGFAVSVFSAICIIRQVIPRLQRFAADADALADGVLHSPIPTGSKDELHGAANALNRLKATLDSIRARQVSEEEVLAAKRYADNIIHSMFDVLIVTDPDLHIKTVNKAACELLEYSELELVGRSIEELFREDPILLGPPIRELLRNNVTRDFEAVYRTASGRLIDVLLSASTMRDNAGRPIAIISVGKDITARKQMERELLEAKASAEAASRAKSAFVANMSHEIRTPMTAILGYADLLLHPTQTAEERRRCIQTLRRNGQHLLTIINDILDVSKIEAGKMTVERITCSPTQIVADVAALMKIRALDRNLPFDVRYIGSIPSAIITDPTRLRQILMNLIGNAIKFTTKGSIKLLVSMLDSPDSSRPRLRFDVTDTGVGLSKEQQESLFKPFAQADSSTTRKFGGTGLGLIISKRLAQMLGGDVVVRSEQNVGSTFSLVIETGPLSGVAMLDSPKLEVTPADPSQLDFSAPPQMSGRVLVAEDGPDNRVLISFYLQHAGLDVTVVENGLLARDAALDAEAAGKPFDLILMDMQRPELDGYSATSQLRAKGYKRPIVALTAHALGGDREKCLAAGCDDFAVKPIDQDQFSRTIKKFLHERHEPAPATGTVTAPPRSAGAGIGMSGGGDSILSKLMSKPATAKLVEKFLAGLGQRATAIQQAFSSKDLPTLKVLAHQLKGAAGGYGFPALTEAARKVEQDVTSNADIKQLGADVRALADLCSQIKAAA